MNNGTTAPPGYVLPSRPRWQGGWNVRALLGAVVAFVMAASAASQWLAAQLNNPVEMGDPIVWFHGVAVFQPFAGLKAKFRFFGAVAEIHSLSCSVNAGRRVSAKFAVSANLRQIHTYGGSIRGSSNLPRRMPLRAYRLRSCRADRRPCFGMQLLYLHKKSLCPLDHSAPAVPLADAVGGPRHLYLQHACCQTSFLPAMWCGAVLYCTLRSGQDRREPAMC